MNSNRKAFISFIHNEFKESKEKDPLSTFGQYNELEFFKLFFDEYLTNLTVNKSNINFKAKLIKKYGKGYDKICFTNNSIPYLYNKYNGIFSIDIFAYIGILIYMGIHHYP